MKRKEKETKFMDYKLDVPYFSQYLDIENKLNLLTACGMTCVYMALKYYNINSDNLDKLVDDGVKNGGYTKNGWLHDYLLTVFQKYEVDSIREERMHDRDVDKIWSHLKNEHPVIISMQRFSFDRRIFHMVLITGYREDNNGNLEGFFYHDPAGLIREEVSNLFVSISVFLQYWRKMAIFPSGKKLPVFPSK